MPLSAKPHSVIKQNKEFGFGRLLVSIGCGEPGEDEVVSCGGILAVDVGESRGAIGSGDGLGVSVAGEA